MKPVIEASSGGGWRNLRDSGVKPRSVIEPVDSINNDLGFRTFRNAREKCIRGDMSRNTKDGGE